MNQRSLNFEFIPMSNLFRPEESAPKTKTKKATNRTITNKITIETRLNPPALTPCASMPSSVSFVPLGFQSHQACSATMSSPVCSPSSTLARPPASVLIVVMESVWACFGVCSQVSPSSKMFWCIPRIQVAVCPAMMKLR